MRKNKDLSYTERCYIEWLYNKEHKKAWEIADLLSRDRSNMYREIKRGLVNVLDTNLIEHQEYSALAAQNNHSESRSQCGTALKIGSNIKYLRHLELLIKEKHYSPYAALMYIKKNPVPFDAGLSLWTIYRYIKLKIFPDLSYRDLPYKRKKKNSNNNENRKAWNYLKAETIENRPVEANERKEPGHFEGDTVVSAKGDKSVLLTLSDRFSRFEIIRKLPNRESKTVSAAFNQIVKDFHLVKFKTITFDNGSEFADWSTIEKTVNCNIFFAHPYRSCDRGTNENNNRIIRRFIPKGSHISEYSDEYIRYIEDWMNHLPRSILNGASALEALEAYT